MSSEWRTAFSVLICSSNSLIRSTVSWSAYAGAYPLVVLDLVVEFLALLTHAKAPHLLVGSPRRLLLKDA